MTNAWMQILTGALGTLGFALCSHVRTKHLAAATLGGLLAWAVYLWIYAQVPSLFLASLISAVAVYAWSEVMARLMKAPVTIFLVPGIIPLLPGSYLYYTMLALLEHDMVLCQLRGADTISATLGIACGVVIASIVISYLLKTVERLRRPRAGR